LQRGSRGTAHDREGMNRAAVARHFPTKRVQVTLCTKEPRIKLSITARRALLEEKPMFIARLPELRPVQIINPGQPNTWIHHGR
jgi:hypothetical protein